MIPRNQFLDYFFDYRTIGVEIRNLKIYVRVPFCHTITPPHHHRALALSSLWHHLQHLFTNTCSFPLTLWQTLRASTNATLHSTLSRWARARLRTARPPFSLPLVILTSAATLRFGARAPVFALTFFVPPDG